MLKAQLKSPLLLVLIGYPGAGKTFFTRQLCERLDLVRINQDEIRATFFKNPSYDKYEDDIVTSMSDIMLKTLLSTGKSIIIDASLDTINERANRRLQAERSGYKVVPIYLQTDVKTAVNRIKLRTKTKLDDKYHGKITRESFERRARRLQKPLESENALTLSGKHTFAAQLATTMKKLSPYVLIPEKAENPSIQSLSPSARVSQLHFRGTTVV
jgi:predicted kinase